jgi:hypothetical protein
VALVAEAKEEAPLQTSLATPPVGKRKLRKEKKRNQRLPGRAKVPERTTVVARPAHLVVDHQLHLVVFGVLRLLVAVVVVIGFGGLLFRQLFVFIVVIVVVFVFFLFLVGFRLFLGIGFGFFLFFLFFLFGFFVVVVVVGLVVLLKLDRDQR